jgi:ATP-dependent protease HslVU (ClpYQ) peptidase subunit
MIRSLPLMFVLWACDPVETSETNDKRTAETKPVVPWTLDPSTTLAKLEGSWVVRGFGSADNSAAWRFEQGKLTIYDPKTKQEKLDRLELWSPCKAHLASGYGGTLVVDGDDIYLGLGDGGIRQGDTIIACMGSGTVYATPKGCATYEIRFGEVKVVPTRCSFPDGRFVTLEGAPDHRKSSLRFWGNDRLLLSDQLASAKLEKQPSWEAAKVAAGVPAAQAKRPPARSVVTEDAARKPDKSSDKPTATFPPPPPEEEKPDVPWKDDHAAAIAKLQGAWVVKGFGSYGSVSAWKIDGAKVTVYSPSKQIEMPDVLLFESPCAVRLDSGYGGTLVTDGDAVYLGLGAGGIKQGDTIVACMGSGTVVATKAGCTTYHEELGKWSKVETTCKETSGRFVATEKSSYGESDVRFVNDHTLLSDQLTASKLVKQPDWPAAKSAADTLNRRR